MKHIKLIAAIVLMGALGSCDKKLDSLLPNPNNPDPATADVDLYLNNAQIGFKSFYRIISDFGGQLTRHQALTGGNLYGNAYAPDNFNIAWSLAYTNVVKSVDALLPLAQEQKKYTQSGIGRVLKAYTLGTLVDNFGDIPSSESDLGTDNLNPAADPGATVYAQVFDLLDSAISDFNKSGAGAAPTNDLFYGGDKGLWTKAAKSLKLKFLMQTRLVDNSVAAKIDALEVDGDLITSEEEDLVFKYSTNVSSPDARHPHYAVNYIEGNTAAEFLGDYFMWAVVAEKSGGSVSSVDPRRRYYFYRQRTNYADVNQQSCPCSSAAVPAHYPSVPDQTPFCLVGAGYWGRDHGDNTGVPPDGPFRTTWGIYPAGGQMDESQGESVDLRLGGQGAGIDPLWMSFFTSFLQAEAALTLGITTAGTPRALLEAGVRGSIAKVLAFPASIGVTVDPTFVPTQTVIDTYVNTYVLAKYDAATTDDQRLEIIMKEYYLSLWGNGIEPYNNYRRTGKPGNLQLMVTTPNPGFFIRSLFYPSFYVNRNVNAPAQKSPGTTADKVFWDNNPDNFIK